MKLDTTVSPEEIKKARIITGSTQAQAADLLEVDIRTWRRWENGERKMPRYAFRLFVILTQGLSAIVRIKN